MLKTKTAPKVFLQIQCIEHYLDHDPYIPTLRKLARHGNVNGHVEIDHVKVDSQSKKGFKKQVNKCKTRK